MIVLDDQTMGWLKRQLDAWYKETYDKECMHRWFKKLEENNNVARMKRFLQLKQED